MHFFKATIAALASASIVYAAPVNPANGELPDGLPNPTPDQLKQIQLKAQGTLPNGPPPPVISKEGIVNLQLIALNELFEVAYFNQLIANITGNVKGYTFDNESKRDFVLKSLEAILAQEELHAIRANTALSHFGANPILPCKYSFPVEDFNSAIVLASTFTDVVLGTLQDVVDRFALGRDVGLARGIASVIGQEGEQQGWFRTLQSKIPSELPFLTTSDLNFAFTAIQGFIVPGSCPNINEIPLQTFEPLTITTQPTAKTQDITITFEAVHGEADQPLWVTYVNQQNLPIVEPLKITSRDGNKIIAQALFPFDENEMNGLTIATVTKSKGPFGDVSQVAKATFAGPGLIIIN